MNRLKLAGALLVVGIVGGGAVAAVAATRGGDAARATQEIPAGTATRVIGSMTVDGIPGAISIRSFSGGVGVVRAPAGKARFDEIRVVKQVDASSPRLFLTVAEGSHWKTVRIELAGGRHVLTLTDVIFTSVKPSQAGAPNDELLEEVSLDYGKIEIEDKPSGKKAGWDVRANKKV